MIEQQAVVTQVNGTNITIKSLNQSACASCASQATCGTSTYAQFLPKREITLKSHIKAHPGDTVLVRIQEQHLVIASLAVYCLPLITMLAFAGLFAETNFSAVLFGVSGLSLGLWLVNRYQYYLVQFVSPPTITRQR